MLFLEDYSENIKMAQNESENEMSGQERTGRAAISEGSRDDADDDDDKLGGDLVSTPTSSSRTSPTEIAHGSDPLQTGRLRGTITESLSARRIAGRRSRPGVNAGRTSSVLVPRNTQDISSGMAMDIGKFECHINNSVMHDPRPGLNQPHCLPVMLVSGTRQVSHNTYENTMDSSPHEVGFGDHAGGQAMVQCLPPHLNRQDGMSIQPWLGMMSDMGPEPAEHIFGRHSQMTAQPHELTHPFFDQPGHEMSGRVHTGMPILSSVQYQRFNDGNRRTLPVREISASQPGMLPPSDVSMNLTTSQYY